MTFSDKAAIAFVVLFLLFMFIGLMYSFGTKKARTRYREGVRKQREVQATRKAAGQTGLKGLQNQVSLMKKKRDDDRNRLAEELVEDAKKLEEAKLILKSEVETYLDNPSTNSMRYRNDLQAIWVKNGFALTWEQKVLELEDPLGDLEYGIRTHDLTVEELQYPTENVMDSQWGSNSRLGT